MSFASQYSDRIWNSIYTVQIPDNLTLNTDYIRKFGTRITGDKKLDRARMNATTTAMIPVIKMVEYYTEGIDIIIEKREDMVKIHKDLELYLGEWREFITHGMNVYLEDHKKLITDLEAFSRKLYEKCKVLEVVDKAVIPKGFAVVSNPFTRLQEDKKEYNKPDYNKITDLVRKKIKPTERF